jgi:mRNA interferase MazF
MTPQPSRGEIWLADLDPTRGREQASVRPVLIVSRNSFNHGLSELVFVLPLTRTDRRLVAHIPIDPPEGGVKARSYILCDAVRSISKERLSGPRWGTVSAKTMAKVEETLRILMDL